MVIMDPSFLEVFDDSVLGPNSMEIVEAAGRKILLAKFNGKIFALDNICPHLGGSLGHGILRNGTVICPLHHWTFSLETGKAVMGVPDEKVALFETKVEEGKIYVKVF
jgi:nitrite reductase/ring-hydroxylating ferredoxin subunit